MGVENPATEEIVAQVALGSVADADRAILAARAAFDGFTPGGGERIALLGSGSLRNTTSAAMRISRSR
jgi:aldehyde dehydrogenase (NAD+)